MKFQRMLKHRWQRFHDFRKIEFTDIILPSYIIGNLKRARIMHSHSPGNLELVMFSWNSL